MISDMMLSATMLLVWSFVSLLGFLPLLWYWKLGHLNSKRTRNPKTYAFFHPYCSGGGGGERVLWKIIQFIQCKNEQTLQKDRERGLSSSDKNETNIIIFTIDPPGTDEAALREDAQRRFDVKIPESVQLISLQDYRHHLDPRPFLSLVLESWGTMQFAYEGFKRVPNIAGEIDVFFDTTGCAFTFLIARWMCPRAWILAYVHYPTISTDMMAWEWQQSSRARWKTIVKLVYYWMFALLYGMAGGLADLVIVNSTWTYGHIRRLWKLSKRIDIVYPPCRVPHERIISSSPRTTGQRSHTIVSIGQFRPEKNHSLQVEALKILLKRYPQHRQEGVKLLLIGSCRNAGDRSRVEKLRVQVQDLDVESFVEFCINPPYCDLQASMKNASIGIHTMRQEHFGIGIVEMMAAGLLVVAHNSGGPKSDIIKPQETGFLATSAEEYAEAIHQALSLPLTAALAMRSKAQEAATRFSDQAFDVALENVLSKLTKI